MPHRICNSFFSINLDNKHSSETTSDNTYCNTTKTKLVSISNNTRSTNTALLIYTTRNVFRFVSMLRRCTMHIELQIALFYPFLSYRVEFENLAPPPRNRVPSFAEEICNIADNVIPREWQARGPSLFRVFTFNNT